MYETACIFGSFKLICWFLQGGFQVYARVSHLEGTIPDFTPPFTDPLIDEIFLEFPDIPAASFQNRFNSVPQTLSASGTFGRVVIEMQATVHCAQGWNGTACEILCTSEDVCSQGIILAILLMLTFFMISFCSVQ